LFVSRRDSLRSVLARSCLQHVGRGRFKAWSCGVPGELAEGAHPAAVQVLESARIALPEHVPRSWKDFVLPGAPRCAVVILLDPLPDADLPAWPGQPDVALWKHPDLLAHGATVHAGDALQLLHSLRRRLEILANLPLHGVDRAAFREDLQDIGHVW
jgi:protein-tyrosine-phosphatase